MSKTGKSVESPLEVTQESLVEVLMWVEAFRTSAYKDGRIPVELAVAALQVVSSAWVEAANLLAEKGLGVRPASMTKNTYLFCQTLKDYICLAFPDIDAEEVGNAITSTMVGSTTRPTFEKAIYKTMTTMAEDKIGELFKRGSNGTKS